MAGLVQRHARTVLVIDLDEGLLDRRQAWLYVIEEAVAAVTGRRISARPLLAEYRLRPLCETVRIVLPGPSHWDRCETLASEMYYRSAMKHLLVHDGIGMALDALREMAVEVGAISREAHANALKQLQSTGLDRFVAALAATPAGTAWAPADRVCDCLRFLGKEPGQCLVVSPLAGDLGPVAESGAAVMLAGWGGAPSAVEGSLTHPRELVDAVRRLLPR